MRLFHWALAVSVAVAWWTQEEDYWLHLVSGYTVLALLLMRVSMGFFGSEHARFSDFVVSPRAVYVYLGKVIRGHPPRYLGHNPAGGTMAIVMFIVLAGITLSGVALDAAENRAGPLAGLRLFYYTDLIEEVHEGLTDLLLGLVVLHLAGVLLASLQHRENLFKAMINGRKRR